MRYLLLILMATMLTPPMLSPMTVQAAEPVIHVVIAVDDRAGFGPNLVTDCKNMERMFRENVPASRLKLVKMDMKRITPDNILDTVNRVKLADGDTLVFYYSGHGAFDANNGGQYFLFKDKNGKEEELRRRTLLAALKDKNARLTVLLTDCCNIDQQSSGNSKETEETDMEPLAAKLPNKISPVFDALFVKPTGVADIISSKHGEASFVDTTGKKRGSCFTWPFVALLEKHRDNGSMTWSAFVNDLRTDVQNAFLECWPEGYKFSPPLNGITVQKTQTVEVYGTLPGNTVYNPGQVVGGPRFGVRGANHYDGIHGNCVRVTEIVQNGPGQRAGFEIGDLITEINGRPIRNEGDYSKTIDDSPKTMRAKVVNVNDGRTLNVTIELGY